jgi:hypothetical protein
MHDERPRTGAKPNKAGQMKKSADPTPRACASRHLRWGWWSLLVWLTFGLVLESLHGFKVGYYLDVSNETRRLMWTLAHAHGTLLALINIAFAVSALHWEAWQTASRSLASWTLLGATLLLPLGFLLGGVKVYDGDPSLGIALVPLGGVLLIAAVLVTARGAASMHRE